MKRPKNSNQRRQELSLLQKHYAECRLTVIVLCLHYSQHPYPQQNQVQNQAQEMLKKKNITKKKKKSDGKMNLTEK